MGTGDMTVGGCRLFFNNGGYNAVGDGYLDLGNVPTLAFQRNATSIEHFSYIASAAAREKDLDIVTDLAMSIAFSIDELFAPNWNLLLYGDGTTSTTQSGSTITDEAATAPVLLDRSVFTAETNVSALTVTNTGASITYTSGTDYTLVNAVTGEIKIIDGGAITTGLGLEFDYTSVARTRLHINPGKDTAVTGSARLEFEVINGNDVTWIIENCELKPDGDTSLSSTEISETNMVLNLLVDKLVTPSRPFGLVKVG